MPVKAGSSTSSVSTESKTGSLSSCRSRLYASGRRLEGGEQAREVADEAARLAARELGDVGVLLLRHDRRARRVAVVERDEAELAGVPEDDLLGEAREVDADLRGRRTRTRRRRRGWRCRRSSSRPGPRARGRRRRMPRRGRAWTRRARPRRTARHPPASSSRRAARGRATSGHAWASRWCASSTGWACCRCVRPGMTAVRCASACAASASMRCTSCCPIVAAWSLQVQPHERGDLVVAAAAGAELAAELGADDADERGLEGAVHVLVGVARRRPRPWRPWTRACRVPASMSASSAVGRGTRPRRARARGRATRRGRRGRAASRSASTSTEAGELGRRAGREAGAPERALVRPCSPPAAARRAPRPSGVLPLEQPDEQRLLGVQAVLGLVPDDDCCGRR